MRLRTAFDCAALLILAALCAGCTPEIHRYMRFPDLYGPGPAPYQRAEAVRHDPYPLNDVGPEITGGRPREYQQPVSEATRAQAYTIPPRGLRPTAIPILPNGSPPVVTAPPVVTGPPVVTSPPVTTPSYPAPPPPAVTTPYPATPPPPATPYQVQPRNPY